MLTCCPSPLWPLTVAVTTTRVSEATKFLMHRCRWPAGSAGRSNLRAEPTTLKSETASTRSEGMLFDGCMFGE